MNVRRRREANYRFDPRYIVAKYRRIGHSHGTMGEVVIPLDDRCSTPPAFECIMLIQHVHPSRILVFCIAQCVLGFVCCVCSADDANSKSIAEGTDPKQIEFFEKHIRPLLVTHCYECHSNHDKKGGLDLGSRDSMLRGGDSGSAIQPGDADASLLIKAVRYHDSDLQMPPKGPISKQELEELERWIKIGAPFPTVNAQAAVAGKLGMSIEEGRAFWSLQPIANPSIPESAFQSWTETSIDRFVAQKLESSSLTPAANADRRTLIRRLTLDLTGLPPTNDEVDAFLSNDAPDAYLQLIDRLLASPQYGVHWGRHWLDVARYADSNGLDENLAFGNAWRYRDYVMSSFNVDKPVDHFVVEQIAGDLLENSTLESKTGTGFLVLGAKVLAEPDREKLTMDTIDEQIDAFGKAFLGMTLGCVRCHDHKFDPILQKDYYGLAAIFKSTQTFGDTNFGAIKHWNEYSFANPSEKEELKKVAAEISNRQSSANGFKSKAMEALRTKTRSSVAHYLAAAPWVDRNMTLQQIASVAEPLGLHPRVLQHCRRHLDFHSEDPLFVHWHHCVKAEKYEEIYPYYSDLFHRASTAWEDAKQKDKNVKRLDDPELERARTALLDPTGLLAIPPKVEFALNESTFKEYDRLATEARIYESFAMDEPSVMSVRDGNVQTSIPLHIRGSHRNLGELVSRRFPEVMCAPKESIILSRKQSGRLELARWMVGPSHPLTARVFVNRVWGWHFGKGLVRTTENFGALGDRPSNPELLDYLARSLIESGWSLKELQRSIVRSNVYRMGASHSNRTAGLQIDPENRLHWHFPSQRMTAEQIRDSILDVAGMLDMQIGGKMVPLRNRQFVFDHTSIDHTKYDSMRRAAFLPVIRNNLYSVFEQFDFPDPTMPTGSRNSTTVAPQSLLLMNSDWVMNAARRIAAESNVGTSMEESIERLYRKVLLRPAREEEMRSAKEFLIANASYESLALLAQTLLICNEFVYLR